MNPQYLRGFHAVEPWFKGVLRKGGVIMAASGGFFSWLFPSSHTPAIGDSTFGATSEKL
jgi:hypothetical protein